MANKEDELDKALEDVPTAKNKNEDPWGHEGRSRPRRSVDLDAPMEDANAPLPGVRATSSAGGLPVRTPSVLTKPPPEQPLNRTKLIAMGAGGLVVVGLIGFAMTRGKSSDVDDDPANRVGVISVTSLPPGAEIFVGGQTTGKKTPAEVPGIRVDSPVEVTVRLAGYLPEPSTLTTRIPIGSSIGLADFKLQPARTIKVITEPPGAVVEADGRLVGGTTPLSLPEVVLGKSLEISIRLEGHRPLKTRVYATDTSSIASFKLEPARALDVNSEPVGARVLVNDENIGLTPIPDLAAPTAKFVLKIERPGFEPYVQRFKAGAKNEKVSATLKLLPLSKMPLAPEDKKRVAELQGDIARTKLDLSSARAKKKSAEAKLDAELKKNRSFVSDTGQYQEIIDREDARAEELEQKLEELNAEWEAIQEEVLGRIGADK